MCKRIKTIVNLYGIINIIYACAGVAGTLDRPETISRIDKIFMDL